MRLTQSRNNDLSFQEILEFPLQDKGHSIAEVDRELGPVLILLWPVLSHLDLPSSMEDTLQPTRKTGNQTAET